MRLISGLSLAAAMLCASLAPHAVLAQDYDGYDEPFDGPPPPRRGYRYGGRTEGPPPRAAGLNCDAVMPGLTGPHPYSCPLPGPRPLGAPCFCETPPAAFSAPRTLAGQVVP